MIRGIQKATTIQQYFLGNKRAEEKLKKREEILADLSKYELSLIDFLREKANRVVVVTEVIDKITDEISDLFAKGSENAPTETPRVVHRWFSHNNDPTKKLDVPDVNKKVRAFIQASVGKIQKLYEKREELIRLRERLNLEKTGLYNKLIKAANDLRRRITKEDSEVKKWTKKEALNIGQEVNLMYKSIRLFNSNRYKDETNWDLDRRLLRY